jgi:PAS domain S-box-containing protein
MAGRGLPSNQEERAGAELARSEDIFQSIYEHAAVGIEQVAVDGRLLMANAALCRMLGYDEAELLSKTCEQITHPDDREREALLLAAVLRGEREFYQIEKRYLHRNGSPVWVSLTSSMVRDAEKKPLFRAVIIQDISERKQAEEALREEKATLQGIFDATRESIWLIGADCTILSANATALKRVGRPAGEMFGKTLHEAIEHKLAESRSACIRQVVETAQPLEVEDERDGMLFRHHYYPVLDSNGCVDRVVVFSRDITQSKRAEETLHRYQLVARHARDIVLFIRYDDGLILEANAAAAEAYGYTNEQLKCMTIHDLREPCTRPLAPGEMAQADTQGILFESIHQRADGSVFPVEVSSQGANIGGSRILISIIRDITQRKQAEEALRNSEQLYRAIGELIDYGVWVCAPDGRNTYASESFLKLVGMTQEQYSDFGWGAALHPDDAERTIAAWKECVRTGRNWDIEHRFRGVDGHWHPILARGVPIRDDHGQITCWAGINLDISRIKQAEQALLRSEKLAAVGRMAAAIAHEINNPLGAVTNLLFLVKGINDLPESARQYLDMADAELRRIAHITRQSLGFYRESNAPAPTSVNEVLESAVDLLKSKINAKQAVIEKQWAKNVEITAVAGELRQVFSNLLVNSLEAIGKKGIIKMRVSTATAFNDSPPCVRVTIADSGNGISAEAQQHIFEPFFTTKGTVGTGLGLWVSKQIIDKHGGSIRMRSSTNGTRRGTVFSVVLPVDPAERGQSAALPKKAGAFPFGGDDPVWCGDR